MEIISLEQKYLFLYRYTQLTHLIRWNQLANSWLFNCSEGCQNVLAQKKIKISQVKKIIVTDLSIAHISGMLGLLSSLSLSTNVNEVHVYGPCGLEHYLFLGRKYSQTKFRYKLFIHNIYPGVILKNGLIRLYVYSLNSSSKYYNYNILINEKKGHFDLNRGRSYRIPLGPLYGDLKTGEDFLLPDATFFLGNNFLNNYYLGDKFIVIDSNLNRISTELLKKATYILSL